MPATRSRRIMALVATLAIAALASACGPTAAPAPAAPQCGAAMGDAVTLAIYNQVNADRAANGLGPLAWNGQLACLAFDWSAQMSAAGDLRHRDLNATIRSPGYGGYRALGENILRGPSSMTGEQMEAAWLASPDHRANILSSAYTSIGISYFVTADGQIYATQNFGG